MKLFVYGELCGLAVLRRVLGRVPPAVPAILPDHTRRPGAHGGYEAAPAKGAQVAGLLLELDGADLARVDRFAGVDGGRYRRARVRVRVLGPDAADVEATTYLAPDGST